MIIGLTGKKGCGKSSVARSLRDNHGYTVRSLADPLKRALEALGVPADNMEVPRLKETPLPQFGDKSAREIMQLFGTEFARNMICDTIWIDALINEVIQLQEDGDTDIVVDDVRFNNEASALIELGGVVIQVERPGYYDGSDGHISENGVSGDLLFGKIENISCYSTDLDIGVTNMLGKVGVSYV
jgi:hypothetical protein